jgi:aminopeptidase N
MYRRAPALLARLEDRIGEEAFDRFLERYMIRQVPTTQELLAHLAEVAGPDAEEWFRVLLSEGPSGVPSGGTAGAARTAPGADASSDPA